MIMKGALQPFNVPLQPHGQLLDKILCRARSSMRGRAALEDKGILKQASVTGIIQP